MQVFEIRNRYWAAASGGLLQTVTRRVGRARVAASDADQRPGATLPRCLTTSPVFGDAPPQTRAVADPALGEPLIEAGGSLPADGQPPRKAARRVGDKTDNIFLLFAISCPVIPKPAPANLRTRKIIETRRKPAFPAIAATFFDVTDKLSLYFALIKSKSGFHRERKRNLRCGA